MTHNTAIVVWFLFLISSSDGGVSESVKWKRRREECKLKRDYVFTEVVSSSLKDCLMSCKSEDTCMSVSWYINGTCLLSKQSTVDDLRPNYIKWELAQGWRTYSKSLYPVARVLNPKPDVNFMTFDEAKAVCAEEGAGLASHDDLLKAGQMGLDECWCSWLADGSVAIVLNDSQCDDYETDEGPEVILCEDYGSKVPAWCKLL